MTVRKRRVPSLLQNLHYRLLDEAIQHGWDAKLSHPASCFDLARVVTDWLCPLHLRSGLCCRARLGTRLSFTLGHVVAPLWVAAHYRATTTATPVWLGGPADHKELRRVHPRRPTCTHWKAPPFYGAREKGTLHPSVRVPLSVQPPHYQDIAASGPKCNLGGRNPFKSN
jgi:hypothetical protein